MARYQLRQPGGGDAEPIDDDRQFMPAKSGQSIIVNLVSTTASLPALARGSSDESSFRTSILPAASPVKDDPLKSSSSTPKTTSAGPSSRATPAADITRPSSSTALPQITKVVSTMTNVAESAVTTTFAVE